MRALLSRWGRVIARLFRIGFQVRSQTLRGLSLVSLALLWIGVQYTFGWGQVLRWLVIDLTHVGFVVTGMGFLLALKALYQTEREADERSVVRLSKRSATAQLRPLLHFEHGPESDVFVLTVDFELRNEGATARRAFFPKLEILRKDGIKWKPFPHAVLSDSLKASMRPKGLPLKREWWFPEKRFEIPANDAVTAGFHQYIRAEQGAAAFLFREFKTRFALDVIGQPEMVFDVLLPKLTEPMKLEDLGDSTASVRSRPSSPKSS